MIRNFIPEDATDLHEIFSDAETMEYSEPPYDWEKTKQFLASFCISRGRAVAAVHKGSGKVIGYILFGEIQPGEYELGWFFNGENAGRDSILFEVAGGSASGKCSDDRSAGHSLSSKYCGCGFRCIVFLRERAPHSRGIRCSQKTGTEVGGRLPCVISGHSRSDCQHCSYTKHVLWAGSKNGGGDVSAYQKRECVLLWRDWGGCRQ